MTAKQFLIELKYAKKRYEKNKIFKVHLDSNLPNQSQKNMIRFFHFNYKLVIFIFIIIFVIFIFLKIDSGDYDSLAPDCLLAVFFFICFFAMRYGTEIVFIENDILKIGRKGRKQMDTEISINQIEEVSYSITSYSKKQNIEFTFHIRQIGESKDYCITQSNLTDLCMLAYLIYFLKDDKLDDIDTLTEDGLLQIKNKICRASILSDDF